MEENIIINGTTDRISQLPESILHHILSFLLSPADLVRSSVLSKQWFDLTASLPILDLNYGKFTRHSQLTDILSRIPAEILANSEDLIKKFWKYVDYTICRFYKEDVSAHTLRLVSLITDHNEEDIIDKCIELSIKRGVQVMVIEVNYLFVDTIPRRPYRLPDILLSASSLTSLTICYCDLPSSLMTYAVKFKSLKKLSIFWVRMDEEMIKYLITSCCVLEEFSINHCVGFKRLCIYGHPNLQKVRIDYWVELEEIEIVAPNIRHLSLLDFESHGTLSMNLALCKNLTTLCFCAYFSLNANAYADFLTNFLFIENLVLTTPEHCNNLKLTSNTLRTLVLHSICQLDVIEINTPNLILFKYSCNTICPAPSVRNSILESKVCMECYPNDDVGSLWFHKLRHFLDKDNVFKVLKLQIRATLIDVEELKVIKSPPFEVEHVELELGIIKELSVYLGVVEAVLWCCRPKSLTLISEFYSIDFEERNRVIKYTYEKLLEQEDQSHTNYIQIVSSFSSKTKNRFSDLDSLLRALPCHPKGLKVTFIKEQVVQEEAGILV